MIPLSNRLGVVAICWLVFTLYWFVSSLFVKKSLTQRGLWWLVWRVALILVVIMFIRLNKSGHPALALFFKFLFRHSFGFTVVGPVLTILGLFGAIWARIYLGRNWSEYATYKDNHALVTKGPYRFVRHPIYSSMILMLIGTTLYYGSWFVCIVLVIAAIALILRIRQEEEIMIKLFGEKYTDYMKRTERLIPLIY